MPPAAGRAVATGRPLETQAFPLNLASGTTGGGHARATTTDGLVSDTARRTDRSPAKSGGPDRHSSQRCVVGSQHLLTKRCVVGPQLALLGLALAAHLGAAAPAPRLTKAEALKQEWKRL